TLLSPFGGHLVDRVRHRRPLLVVTNAVIGLATLSLLAIHDRHQLWVIYAVAAATGLATDVLSSSRSALLKDMVADEHLGQANAVLQTLSQGTRLLSPLLGAGLYTLLGGHGLAIVVAALFAVAAAALTMVRVDESPVEPPGRLRAELMAGFRHVRSVPLLTQLVIVGALAFSVVGLLETVAFAIISQGLHRPPAFYGVIDTVQGAGAVAGAVLATRVMRRFGEARTVGIGLALVGIGAVALTAPALVPVLAGTIVLGFGVPLFVVGWATGLQRYTPARLQGRTNAAANLMLTVPQTASIGLGAALIAVVDYRILLLVIFLGMAASGAVLLVRPATAAPVNEPVTAAAT
ncbi:MAG TPA: MFS transporter, partial [Pseudonocardiaceae bacterium]|nr:MFS transporter [Pseudonocardiaceae bacterium]